ncbi:MAG: DUF4233 domain-containing protein [Microbacterium sp.]|nr:DUF4233 domain-containing protein [Microbacterium sp.]MBA4345706.1 DUF4233 domain-containing protein [Microbacterium sp.]
MTDTTAAPDSPARRPKRERGALESLLTVTLGMEVLAVIFGTLAINGLDVAPPGVVFGVGGVLVLLLLIATRVVRYRWGVWFGHVLQVVLLSTGFIEFLAAVTAAIFVGFWIYCFVKGTQLDAAKRAAA